MIKYFQTTTLILIWCFLISIVWSWFVFFWISRKPGYQYKGSGHPAPLLPVLVLGPVALVVFYKVFRINLLFPIHMFSSFITLVAAAFVPAFILVLASGLSGLIRRYVCREYSHWQQAQFSTVHKAFGRDVTRSLRRLVLVKAFTGAWAQALPWLFGELVIIECIFNAPGLGLDAWNMAKIRDMSALGEAVFGLMVLYGVCVGICGLVSGWIGRRLESYS
jgi:ABC-type dipeptide/oligopeptide/nickel transport system permease component